MTTNNKILIVDDDIELTELLTEFLSKNGFQVFSEAGGKIAAERILMEKPALVILDVMLPDIDGLTICRNLRSGFNGTSEVYQGPILMLTALDDDIDEVAGLEIGADDYLAKPIRARVLLARVRALLRRDKTNTSVENGDTLDANKTSQLVFKDIVIDKSSRGLKIKDKDIGLTAAEFELVYLLASRAGHIFSRDEIGQYFNQLGYESSNRTIDLRISRIRRKLGDDSLQAQTIKTVHGKGYLFVAGH